MSVVNIILTLVVLFIIFLIFASIIGSFTVKTPSWYISPYSKRIIYSILISFVIVLPLTRQINILSVVSIIILSVIMYIIITSASYDSYTDSLPYTVSPPSPHLGLDGVSINNSYTGNDLSKYNI